MEKKIPVQYSRPYPTDVDLSQYDVRFWVEGDCLDSPDSPIRLKDGQRLRVHELERDEGVFHIYRHIEEMRGKVCTIMFVENGKRYCLVKEVIGLDEPTGTLRLTYYNPKKTDIYLKIDSIERVYIVDGVIDQ